MAKSAHVPELAMTSSAAMFRIICKSENGTICGHISNACYEMSIPFAGLDKMLMKIDDMCEAINYPMSDTRARFMEYKTARVLPRPSKRMSDKWRTYSPYEWAQATKEGYDLSEDQIYAGEHVFLLHVIYRRNSSLQGLIIEKTNLWKKNYFRSGLELMRMIDYCVAKRESDESR